MAASFPSCFFYHQQHCLTPCFVVFVCYFVPVWFVCVYFALLVCVFGSSFVLCLLCFFYSDLAIAASDSIQRLHCSFRFNPAPAFLTGKLD